MKLTRGTNLGPWLISNDEIEYTGSLGFIDEPRFLCPSTPPPTAETSANLELLQFTDKDNKGDPEPGD
ncbi:hypothetical protein CHU98_g10560 [Xylaria longipes]|nr:hypothetical protein CHU98_g10560 [Xylaria longipes]